MSSLPRIIGLNGVARAGKDTIANALRDLYGYQIFERGGASGFSAILNEALIALDPWTGPWVSDFGRHDTYERYSVIIKRLGYEKAKEHSEIRRLLQAMGTEVGRNLLGEDIWVDAMFDNLEGGPVVITNVRFPNEYEAVKKRGGVVWRVNRPGYVAAQGHISDTALDDHEFDHVFVNDSTIEALAIRVTDVLYKYSTRGLDTVIACP